MLLRSIASSLQASLQGLHDAADRHHRLLVLRTTNNQVQQRTTSVFLELRRWLAAQHQVDESEKQIFSRRYPELVLDCCDSKVLQTASCLPSMSLRALYQHTPQTIESSRDFQNSGAQLCVNGKVSQRSSSIRFGLFRAIQEQSDQSVDNAISMPNHLANFTVHCKIANDGGRTFLEGPKNVTVILEEEARADAIASRFNGPHLCFRRTTP